MFCVLHAAHGTGTFNINSTITCDFPHKNKLLCVL